jgi:hypothetical protein
VLGRRGADLEDLGVREGGDARDAARRCLERGCDPSALLVRVLTEVHDLADVQRPESRDGGWRGKGVERRDVAQLADPEGREGVEQGRDRGSAGLAGEVPDDTPDGSGPDVRAPVSVTRQRQGAPPAETRVGAGHRRCDARGTVRQSRRRPGGVGLDCGMENPNR